MSYLCGDSTQRPGNDKGPAHKELGLLVEEQMNFNCLLKTNTLDTEEHILKEAQNFLVAKLGEPLSQHPQRQESSKLMSMHATNDTPAEL